MMGGGGGGGGGVRVHGAVEVAYKGWGCGGCI